MSSDRTPAEALAHARYTVEGYGEDHPWHVAWDAMRPTLRQELVEDAEVDIEHLAAAGFRVVPEPDDDTRALANFLIEQADSYARLAGDTYGRPDDQVRAELLDTEAKFRAAAAYLSGDPEEGR